MKIKFATSLVGADFVRHPGEVADIDDAEAARLVAAGYAKPVKGTPAKLETATVKPVVEETATTDSPLPRGTINK